MAHDKLVNILTLTDGPFDGSDVGLVFHINGRYGENMHQLAKQRCSCLQMAHRLASKWFLSAIQDGMK